MLVPILWEELENLFVLKVQNVVQGVNWRWAMCLTSPNLTQLVSFSQSVMQ